MSNRPLLCAFLALITFSAWVGASAWAGKITAEQPTTYPSAAGR